MCKLYILGTSMKNHMNYETETRKGWYNEYANIWMWDEIYMYSLHESESIENVISIPKSKYD